MIQSGVLVIFVYLASAVFVLGLALRLTSYLRTPQRLPVAVTPAPRGWGGVTWRLLKEVTVFASLFQSNKWVWFFGWVFHASLLLVMVRHLRYFMEPVPTWVVWLQPLGRYAGISMVLALLALWARRLLVDRVRFVSTVSDHLLLVLLLFIGISGLVMSFLIHTDVVAVKRFTLGLLSLESKALPGGPMTMHFILVGVLLLVFPVSKLLHVPGVFVSPSRAMVDRPRGPLRAEDS